MCCTWLGVEFEKISLVEDRFMAVEKEIESKSQMLARIKVHLAGISALRQNINDTFSNSNADITKAREIAHEMVFEYAMGKTFVPNPADIEEILQNAYSEVGDFLQGMKVQLGYVSDYISEFESIDKNSIKEIIQKSYN